MKYCNVRDKSHSLTRRKKTVFGTAIHNSSVNVLALPSVANSPKDFLFGKKTTGGSGLYTFSTRCFLQ